MATINRPAIGPRTVMASRGEFPRIFAVASQKGGVGKTDLTVNVACQLALEGNRVLMIDLDPQANATDYLVPPGAQAGKTTADLLLDESVTLGDAILQGVRENLDVVPAHQNLSSCQIKLANDINMQFKLKKKLKALSELNEAYDFVFIDTPPSLGLLMVNTLTAATGVIIPVQTQYFAMDGMVQLQETIQKMREDINPGLKVLGIVLTMYDRRTVISREVGEKIRAESGDRVFNTVIPVNVRLAEAPSHHKSIFEYDPDSSGARAYKELVRELLSCPDV